MSESGDVVKYSGYTVPISRELLADAKVVNFGDFSEYFIYGKPRTNRNFMPQFVPFPRIQRAEDWLRRTAGRFSDAISAFRYGLPEEDGDW